MLGVKQKRQPFSAITSNNIRRTLAMGVLTLLLQAGGASDAVAADLPRYLIYPNQSGIAATYSLNAVIDRDNEFFQPIGANGRSCVSCHQPKDGWTITPAGVQARFTASEGTDPLFRPVDGANSPDADVSTVAARRSAYSMLLSKGLIRVGLPVPDDAEFELVAVDDPYGYAHASDLSLFRRPMPTTNLRFLSAIMWDGRETVAGHSVHFDLGTQANSATTGHAQSATPLTMKQRESIVDFETSLFTAQVMDWKAGQLDAYGAKGGAVNLSKQPFYIGVNDNFNDSMTDAAFDPNVFDIYDAWNDLQGGYVSRMRASVARGQKIFNTKQIFIKGVSGLNDEDVFGNPDTVDGTCTTCHNTPNAGDHSVVAPLNIGISDASRRTPDMPLYTFRNKVTGDEVQTTDPGRALVSGKWKHIGRFKGPILRALATRPPYFHNGSAADLESVVQFYQDRFSIDFTPQEKRDLVMFLRTL